ncbi:hypothetical protein [Mesorhizobium sp.]|uniref:hypothetical protein n=1 Tax=Mesorhizobium sp. TaxID=1871066 RepID=UPI0025BCB164|nr:hypothetical protein [Mesorhizobium sp.]
MPAASHNTHLRQEPIHRRCADRQQLVAKLAIHIKLAMPRKRRQQDGDQRLQSFRAEPVGRLPQHHQSLSNLSSITGGMPPLGRRLRLMTAEHTDRVLAVIAGDRDKLIQDPLLVGPAA